MKYYQIIIVILAIAVLATDVATAASFQVGTADAGGAKGSTVNVPVTVSEANNVGSMDILVVYDPAVLTATGVDKGTLNKGMISANTSAPGFIAISLADSNGITGSGDVAVITFSVIGNATETSTVRLQSVKAYDGTSFLDVPSTISSGTFIVKEGTAATPTAKSGSESLIIFSLIGLAFAFIVMGKRGKG